MKHEAFVKRLTDILLKRHVISKEDADALAEAFEGSAKPYFDDFLLDEGIVDKDDLLPALSEYYQVPAFDVMGYFFKNQLLRMFPKNLLYNKAIIPMERDQNMLVVVVSNPDDPELLALLGNHVSYDIRFNVGIRQDIMDAVQEFYAESLTQRDFEADMSQTREMREKEIADEKELGELTYDVYEEDE